MAAGFVIMALGNGGEAIPRWLSDDGIDKDFGPRHKATIFATRAEAMAVAAEWEELLHPALSITVEAA
jgi:hypothetical protein